MVKIIAVTNRKGGVGKSTCTVHIAAGLATLGARVGIVDTDSQGHASTMLNMPEMDGLHAILIDKRPLEQIIQPVPEAHYTPPDHSASGALYLLPGSHLTYKIPLELKQDETFLFLETLEQMGEVFNLDIILIDTNPTLNLFDGAVYLAADGYIYVTECERLSLEGITDAVSQMQRFSRQRQKYLQRDTRIVGIIPNKFRANTQVHRLNITSVAEAFPGLVWSPVTLRAAWVEAANLREPIYKYAPSSQAARDAWRIAERTGQEVLSWPIPSNA